MESLEELLGRLRQHTDWVDHGRIVKVILALGEPAVPRLIEALGEEDGFVRAGAAEALGEIGDRRAVEPLIAALALPADSEEAEHVEACVQIVVALGRLGDSRAIAPLIKWLPDFLPEPVGGFCVSWYLIEALGLLNAVEAEPLIRPLIDHPDVNVRKDAIRALKRLRPTDDQEPLRS
jgi:HEAT repeat protein